MFKTYVKALWKPTLIVGVVVVLWFVTVQGNGIESTFATGQGTGALQLKLDSKTWYNGAYQPKLSWTLKNLTPGVDKFFNFNDIKPGDTGTSSLSVHLSPVPAWACLDFTNLTDTEGGINEPESKVDTSTSTGELAEGLEFFGWRDDGDYKFEVGEKPLFGTSTQSAKILLDNKTYPLADALTLPAYAPNVTYYVGMHWCAGDLSVNLATAVISCNGAVLGNEAQTDSMGIDVSVRAVTAAGQPKFTCNNVPPPPVQQCEIEGHKYDQNGKPLANWDIRLVKKIKHNKGIDTFDLATDTTDADGYYCLEWNGESRTPRGTPTYKSGPYTFEYFVFEKMQSNWGNVSIEKGPNYNALTVVPGGNIIYDGGFVGVSLGSGYIIANAAYHVDFYNKLSKDKKKNITKGKHVYEPNQWNYSSAKPPAGNYVSNIVQKVTGNKKP